MSEPPESSSSAPSPLSRLFARRSDDAINRSAPGPERTPILPRKRRLSFLYWATIFLALLWGQSVLSQRDTQTISYDVFLQDLRNGRIAEVTLSGAEIRGRYVSANKEGRMAFVTARVDPAFAAELDRYHVRFSTDTVDQWGPTLLAWITLVLLWNLIWRMLMDRRAQASRRR